MAGDFIEFPELADTLEAISRGGADAFYTDGRIAQSIVNTVNASGGIMTLEDLRIYTVKLEEPLRTQYNGRLKEKEKERKKKVSTGEALEPGLRRY